MKRRMIVVGMCAGMWLCGSVWGQETVVSNNLAVMNSLRMGTSQVPGTNASALGSDCSADGDFSHAEGDTTAAEGIASHAEGAFTIAHGDQSHAGGYATEAMADNSHAEGACARVRTNDVNSFIHAVGTTNVMKETQFPDTAHFDHVVTLEPALNASNAILSRIENDQRYLRQNGNSVSTTAVWSNWNADMLDGHHASDFATSQQLDQKLSTTGGWANATFSITSGNLGPWVDPRTQIKMGGDGNIELVGGEETVADDNMHIKMRWDVVADDPADPSIELKPYGGALLKGLNGSDRWWTDGRFCATNAGKTSEFFAVNSGRFVGDGSGLTNLPVTGLTTNEADARYATVVQGALAESAIQPGTEISVASIHVMGNTNTASGSSIAGGNSNYAGTNSFVGGGGGNQAGAYGSVVAGGMYNFISNQATYAAIGGGFQNCIYGGRYSVIGGGRNNALFATTPSASSVVGGGGFNYVSGSYSVIPGGWHNSVTGAYGMAAGNYAYVGHDGAFVWADSSSSSNFATTSSNQFLIRATGGMGINTNVTTGMALAVAGNVEVVGTGRFTMGLRVPQQGDISMGTYTNGTF